MSLQSSDRSNLPPLDLVHKLAARAKIESINPHDPVQVTQTPSPWQLLGAGNYAAVFTHPNYQDVVIKVYASGRSGWAEEVEVRTYALTKR
jgi:hypothetical protein